jgi:short-subunit dehydrogenase
MASTAPVQEKLPDSQDKLAGKVAVITGASMGIGEAIARLFVDHGSHVVLLSRDSGRVESARARIGHAERTMALACDVRNREEIDRVIGLTMHHFGRIDVWINNAGHGILDSVAAVSMASTRETFDTNFFGTMDAMQAVIPIMKQQGGGTIINISSVAGHIPIPFHGVYSATKFAMNALGKAARIELAGAGINVLTVCPGYVKTDFAANAVKGVEPKRVRPKSAKRITVERVARATLKGYLNKKKEVVVPWTMIPAIKLYQLFPGIVEKAMIRMARNAGTV